MGRLNFSLPIVWDTQRRAISLSLTSQYPGKTGTQPNILLVERKAREDKKKII